MRLRATVDAKLQSIQEDNAKRLETMRQTVDEKLQGTLEKRLGESFKFVGDRLEAVQAGLGEMRTLANGVGDLKKVLSNVKIKGEIQLGNLLAQMLAPEQFVANVVTKPLASERVNSRSSFRAVRTARKCSCPSTRSSRWRTTSGWLTRPSVAIRMPSTSAHASSWA